MLPGVRRLSALRFSWKAHAVRVARDGTEGAGASTGRTRDPYPASAGMRSQLITTTH